MRAATAIALAAALAACTEPVSWQKLVAAKIEQQYAGYKAEPTADGNLRVTRPGQADVPVDVNDISRFCQRGPKDCDYATDQMLLQLAKP